jgi:NAD(P)-dependent dehydrogenase (short-subunit alcohol dehydrogenase family)
MLITVSTTPLPCFDLSGRTIVVTGGAGWLGRPMVQALAEAGAKVVIASRDAERGETVVRDFVARGLSVSYLDYDQAEENSINTLLSRTIGLHGRVDVLVNNAALWPMRTRDAPLADFARSMQINATGLFGITRAFGEHMAAQQSGVIVNVGSSFGLVGPDFSLYQGLPVEGGLPDYFFHKGGMLQLTRYAAALYGPRGVRVNTLSLGPIRKRQSDELAYRFAARTLLRRMGSPAEVGGAVVFLASDASSFMTGSNLVVDGGYTSV